jgi:hypothetical protein
MPPPPTPGEIREVLLQAAEHIRPRDRMDPSLQLGTLFREVTGRLGGRVDGATEQEILTQWHELLRTGYFAWGLNLGNPSPPFFHFTDRAERAMKWLARDPSNPAGYLHHLRSVAVLNPVAESYIQEGLACFEAGLFKSAAVMVGTASESVLLELRGVLASCLGRLGRQEPRGLSDWRVKTVLDTLHTYLDAQKGNFPRVLRDEFEAYFLAFAQQIRASRNDAGHPSSVDPVTEESVHASFLIFPEVARLANALSAWVSNDLR